MTKFKLNEQEEEYYLAYEPIKPDIINWMELKSSTQFAIKSYKDSVYRGEIVDSMRSGKGVITYNSSRVYEGEW